ncbi:MAG: ABC transporter permease [Candidatus Bipolaricaulota bacterium]|nr:ABC transporter permease [Candidatus Bipolaricaulota bacterium]MDW8030672.1 ABC transporter permease [Candidatus Bipolaricaulota bacterium]
MKQLRLTYPSILVFGGLLVAWEFFVRLAEVPLFLLPTPSQIALRFVSDFSLLAEHLLVTLGEIALGFVLALMSAFLIALAIFYNKTVERVFYPIIIFLQNMPLFALAPLLKLWLGFTIWPKVTVAAIIAFFPIVVNTVDGLRATDPDLIDLLKIFGASKRQILQKVQLPSALPFIFSGARVGITLSVVGAVIGEWVGAQAGLGYVMLRANATLKTDLVFAAIFALALLGVVLFGLLTLLERWALPWRRLQ